MVINSSQKIDGGYEGVHGSSSALSNPLQQSPSSRTMVAIAYCFSGLPTPSISPQGVVGHFPNLHCPSLTFAHLRTNFNTPMATTPFQVSASSSSSTIGLISLYFSYFSLKFF
ncbi:hypothetical protein GBA52_025928 [Prunus armeniaca]|nr:hypothetical protein GBA52_025928 [Prunus armeniaca]